MIETYMNGIIKDRFLKTNGNKIYKSFRNDLNANDCVFSGTMDERENRNKILFQNIHEYIYCVTVQNSEFVSAFHSMESFEVTGYSAEEYCSDPDLWFNMIFEENCWRISDFLQESADAVYPSVNPSMEISYILLTICED